MLCYLNVIFVIIMVIEINIFFIDKDTTYMQLILPQATCFSEINSSQAIPLKKARQLVSY